MSDASLHKEGESEKMRKSYVLTYGRVKVSCYVEVNGAKWDITHV